MISNPILAKVVVRKDPGEFKYGDEGYIYGYIQTKDDITKAVFVRPYDGFMGVVDLSRLRVWTTANHFKFQGQQNDQGS